MLAFLLAGLIVFLGETSTNGCLCSRPPSLVYGASRAGRREPLNLNDKAGADELFRSTNTAVELLNEDNNRFPEECASVKERVILGIGTYLRGCRRAQIWRARWIRESWRHYLLLRCSNRHPQENRTSGTYKRSSYIAMNYCMLRLAGLSLRPLRTCQLPPTAHPFLPSFPVLLAARSPPNSRSRPCARSTKLVEFHVSSRMHVSDFPEGDQ